MNVRITPHPLCGEVCAPPSKSQTHRALICAALADAPTAVRGAGGAEDVQATVRCLRALGADIVREGDALLVSPLRLAEKGALLDCGESGSTLRFLLPLAAALGAACSFTGGGRLSVRPLWPLYEQLRIHGARMSREGTFPLGCAGRLQAGDYVLPGNVSSQFVTGLMLALPLLEHGSRIRLTSALQSAPYAEMTRAMLARFGVMIENTADGFLIPGGQRFRSPGTVTAEGDWSAAACWLAAGALGGSGVRCTGLAGDSPQGDRAIVQLLRRFGAEVTEEDGAVTARPAPLRGTEIDLTDIPDLAPILAVLAAAAAGETRLRPVARLRFKESDRVESIAAMLRSLGIETAAEQDSLFIRGGALRGGRVDGCGDHRIVMAAAVAAGAARGPVTILGAEAVGKSYPDFFERFAALGGCAEEAEA